jgi:hypothetical protein
MFNGRLHMLNTTHCAGRAPCHKLPTQFWRAAAHDGSAHTKARPPPQLPPPALSINHPHPHQLPASLSHLSKARRRRSAATQLSGPLSWGRGRHRVALPDADPGTRSGSRHCTGLGTAREKQGVHDIQSSSDAGGGRGPAWQGRDAPCATQHTRHTHAPPAEAVSPPEASSLQ